MKQHLHFWSNFLEYDLWVTRTHTLSVGFLASVKAEEGGSTSCEPFISPLVATLSHKKKTPFSEQIGAIYGDAAVKSVNLAEVHKGRISGAPTAQDTFENSHAARHSIWRKLPKTRAYITIDAFKNFMATVIDTLLQQGYKPGEESHRRDNF